MIKINIKLFGVFKKYEDPNFPMALEIQQPVTVSDLRKILEMQFKKMFSSFNDTELVYDSAIANDTRILGLNELVQDSCTLLILPPVCGG